MRELFTGDRKRLATIVAVMLGLFAVMAVVRVAVESRLGAATDVEGAYQQLLAELAASDLLLPSEVEQGLNALNLQSVDPFGVDATYTEGNPVITLKLQEALLLEFAEGTGAYRLEINPQEYKCFKAGTLQTALREISKIKLEQQAKALSGSSAIPSKHFSISLVHGSRTYRFTPTFTGEKCTLITILPVE